MKFLKSHRPEAVDADADADGAISHFQSQTAEITEAPDPAWARGAVVLFALMVIGGIAMAGILRVERVVVARGIVASQTPTIVVQPLETAVVDSIEVREGDVVRKGQILARLNPTISEADLNALQRRAASLDARIGRLEAEVSGNPYEPDTSNEFVELQQAVYRHRAAEFKSSMANYEQRIDESRSEMERNVRQASLLADRLELLGEVVTMRATLEQNEVGSRLNSILAKDGRLEVENTLAESEGLAAAARHRLSALQSERDVFEEKWRAESVRELVEARDEANQVSEELAKAVFRRSLVALRAVEDGIVLDVAPVSVGSVITAAKEIFRLVPLNAELEIEAEISGADQGFIAEGDSVVIKFDAYPFIKHGTAKGRITQISDDSFSATEGPMAGRPFYRARIEIEEADLRQVPEDFRLIPGMPVTADVVVGDRSILASLTGGLAEVISTGLREP